MRLLEVLIALCLALGLGVQTQARSPRVPKSERKAQQPRGHRPRFQAHPVDHPARGPARPPLHELPSLCIVGLTGGLGRQIAREAISRGTHRVSGTVRSTTRAHEVFSKEELLNMQIFEGSFDPAERKQSEAFLSRVFESVRADAVVEVLSNSVRPEAIDAVLTASANNNVSSVTVCGGAGQLYAEAQQQDREPPRIGTAAGSPDWLVEVTKLHMDVQRMAFRYAKNFRIPVVFQIAPPAMSPGKSTGKYDLGFDVYEHGAPMSATYGDVAAMYLDALVNPEAANLKMAALKPRVPQSLGAREL
eukprot:INCI15096.1.p1 GENE.INCI15096.1~~INCI15096.1.p1  ORF type:complete len:304 (-),score=47.80 INCI15096.1:179-1090(-)